MREYFLAFDMGASSGRGILSWMEDGKIRLEELNRFDNHLIEKNGHLTWDVDALWEGILTGLKACRESGRLPKSIGIDTWAVDYVLLDEYGSMIGDAVCYRDGRTAGMREEARRFISDEGLYARTGIQYQPFNTIYQLLALKKEHPGQLEEAQHLLMLPDYFNYLLTGSMKQEYTNATSTSLVNAESREWDMEIIRRLGLPERLFTKLSVPGTVVGTLRPEIQKLVGFDSTVVLPATHDTGSAFLSAPYSGRTVDGGSDTHTSKADAQASGNTAVRTSEDTSAQGGTLILSSGTWSLLGVENKSAITTPASRKANFTNEGGAWYRYRYLKNIMGLWMIQSVRRELNGVSYVAGNSVSEGIQLEGAAGHGQWSFPDLIAAAKEAKDFMSEVDVNDERFLSPENMITEVQAACRESGRKVPASVGELMQCLYLSLTTCYKKAVEELTVLSGKTYGAINIIGGGCQDAYLDEMTAKRTGLTVYAGPVEGTAIGNLAVQMITAGVFKDLDEARSCIAESFEIRRFDP